MPAHVLTKAKERRHVELLRGSCCSLLGIKSALPPRCWRKDDKLVNCGEEEVVRGVHTLIAGVMQVYHRRHAGEEEEKGRKVEQEVEREDQGEENTHTSMTMWMR